ARMVMDAWITPTLERAVIPTRATAYRLPDEVCDQHPIRSLAAAIQYLERGEHAEASAWLAAGMNCTGDNDGFASRRSLIAILIWLSLACEGTDSAREIDEAGALLDEDADEGS